MLNQCAPDFCWAGTWYFLHFLRTGPFVVGSWEGYDEGLIIILHEWRKQVLKSVCFLHDKLYVERRRGSAPRARTGVTFASTRGWCFRTGGRGGRGERGGYLCSALLCCCCCWFLLKVGVGTCLCAGVLYTGGLGCM